MVYAGGTRAVLQSGNRFLILDVSDPEHPRQIARHQVNIIYGNEMSRGDVGGRYACVSGHVNGIRWLDFAAADEAINTGINLVDYYSHLAGIVSLGDQFLCTGPGIYRLAKPLDTDLEKKPAYRFAKHFLGKPSVFGNGLFLASRDRSAIAIVDITDLHHPRLLCHLPTAGNPSTVVVRNEALIIPDGRNGLLVYDDFVNALDLKVDKRTFLAP